MGQWVWLEALACYHPPTFFSPRTPPAMPTTPAPTRGDGQRRNGNQETDHLFRTSTSQPNLDGSWGPPLSSGLLSRAPHMLIPEQLLYHLVPGRKELRRNMGQD